LLVFHFGPSHSRNFLKWRSKAINTHSIKEA
jgi:hypothetical protein